LLRICNKVIIKDLLNPSQKTVMIKNKWKVLQLRKKAD